LVNYISTFHLGHCTNQYSHDCCDTTSVSACHSSWFAHEWQPLYHDAGSVSGPTRQPALHALLVEIEAVLHDDQRPAHREVQHPQELGCVGGFCVACVHANDGRRPASITLGQHDDRRDHAQPIASVHTGDDQRLTAWGQELTHQRPKHEPGFVVVRDGGVQTPRIVLRPGQSRSRHRSMAFPSRSRARASGLWTPRPTECGISPTPLQSYYAPSDPPIRSATRRHVHQSFSHPAATSPVLSSANSRLLWALSSSDVRPEGALRSDRRGSAGASLSSIASQTKAPTRPTAPVHWFPFPGQAGRLSAAAMLPALPERPWTSSTLDRRMDRHLYCCAEINMFPTHDDVP